MKKILLYLFVLLSIICAVGCSDAEEAIQAAAPVAQPAKESKKDTRSLIARVFDDSESLFRDTEQIMIGSFNAWDDAETLHEALSMYTDYAYKYASDVDAWKAALEYFRYDMLEKYPDVFGSGDSPDSLKAAITKADKVSLDALQIILNVIEVYDKYFDDDGLDKLRMLTDDTIVVEKPNTNYDGNGDIIIYEETDKKNGFYPSIMTNEKQGTDTPDDTSDDVTVYTLKYPKYYSWAGEEGASYSVPNSVKTEEPGGSGPTVQPQQVEATITLTHGSNELTSSTYTLKYINSLYTFNYNVELPEESTATVSTKVTTTNSSLIFTGTDTSTSGRIFFKNPGKYKITVTVTPGANETGKIAKSKTYSIRINDPFTDVSDEYLDKVAWSLLTPLATAFEECAPEDCSSKNAVVHDFIEAMATDNVTTAQKVYDYLIGDKALLLSKKNYLYDGISSGWTDLISYFSSDLNIEEGIEGTKNALKKYSSTDTAYYNTLLDMNDLHDSESLKKDDVVYSYLELLIPLYLKDAINNLNIAIKELSSIKNNIGLFYETELLTSADNSNPKATLNITNLYTLFTGKYVEEGETPSSILNSILNPTESMPYPFISYDETTPAGTVEDDFINLKDEDKQLFAQFLNLLALVEEPESLLDHTDILDVIYDFVDDLQSAMYFGEHVYVYSSEDSKFTYTVPNTLISIIDILLQLDVIDIDDIPGYEDSKREDPLSTTEIEEAFIKYYPVRKTVDDAVAALKNAIKLEITTILPL